MLRLLRQISYRQLRASWGRTALVVGGIATGVSLIVAINVINTSVLANFRRTIDLVAGPAQLQVTLGAGEIGFAEEIVDDVRADADVVAAVPMVRGTISLADDPAQTLQLFGVDLTAEEDLKRYQVVATTSRREILRWMAEPRAILLTAELAAARHIDVGGRLVLSTPSGVHEFVVRGLLATAGMARAFGGQLVIMDLPAAQLALGRQQRVDQIDVVLRQDADVAAAQRRLSVRLPAVLNVGRPAERGALYESILASFQAMLTGLSTLCLVAGIFIVYNTTSTGAVRRATALAELRVVGADGARLLRLLMTEAAALGVLGSVLGLAVGTALAWVLRGMVAESMGVIFQLRFPIERLSFDAPQQVAIGLLGIAASISASYFAARHVTTLDPLDVMRGDLRHNLRRPAPRRLVIWWVTLVSVSAGALLLEGRFQSIAWGNLGSTLWNGSIIVIAIPLVGWLGGALDQVLPRLFGAEGRFAVASILRSTVRTGVTVAAIALVLTVGVTLASLAFSFRMSMNNYVGRFLAGDLVVSAVATEGGWLETPLPAAVAHALIDVPGVSAVETGRALPGQIFRGHRIGILALSPGMFDPARYPASWFRDGDPVAASRAVVRGDGVTISTGLADRFGLVVGDQIELPTPGGPLSVRVVGIVPDYISDQGSVLMTRDVFLRWWSDDTVSRIFVSVKSDASPEVVRADIAARFGSQFRLKVLLLRQVLDYHDDMIDRAFAFTQAIQLLIIIVTVAGILDLLLSSIVERRRELGLWRMIGADDRPVRRSIVIESATVGTIGAVLGGAVGLVTAWIWVGVNFRYLLGYYLEYHFALGATLWYFALVLGMTMLAGNVAAFWETRVSVLERIQVAWRE